MHSHNLRTSSFSNHSPGPSSHTWGVCLALFDLSSPLCIFLLHPSFTFPSHYLLGRIVALVMSDCSNSQGKKDELISVPPMKLTCKEKRRQCCETNKRNDLPEGVRVLISHQLYHQIHRISSDSYNKFLFISTSLSIPFLCDEIKIILFLVCLF